MKKRKGFQGLSLIMAASLVMGGCGNAETDAAAEAETASIAVKAAEAELGTLTISNEFVGTVSAQQEVSIIPLVSGEVDAVYFEVGDMVEAGDVLFHIDDEAAKLQEESARLQRQNIDVSAKAQLGAGQVLSNISMQSNIKSLEFQIQSAKDQYDSAVQGIVDAEDAKEEIGEALDSINSSVSSLKSEQAKRESVISNAQNYITLGSWEVAYNWDEDPDHYTWGDAQEEPSEDDPAESESQTESDAASQAANTAISNLQNALNGSGSTSLTGSAAQESPETSAPEESVPSEESREQTENESGAADEDAGATNAAVDGTDANAGTDDGTDTNAELQSQQSDEANADSGAPLTLRNIEGMSAGIGAYYGAETLRAAEGVYFAETGVYFAAENTIPAQSVSKEEAWEAYNRQQKINAAKSAAESMGYSASDISNGTASRDMLEVAAEITALEYQASQLQSNQASLESSISQAETAKDTTAKTIDFYEDNLKDAQVSYGIQNGQVYQDTAEALATQQQSADVAIKSAQMQLEYYSPTTPISGKVISKNVEVYGMTQAGYAAYVISNQDAMNVTFLVSGQVKSSLSVGQSVTITKNGESYPGTITEIGEAVAAQSGGLFSVKAVTEAAGDKLASGTAVKLSVDTFKSENTILIPYDAVHFESERAYVYVIEDGKLIRTQVTLGLMNEDTVEVTEGLAAGSQVVSTWSSQLEDGAAVRVIGEAKE